MEKIEFEIGDFVHATFYNFETDSTAVQQFIITEIDGTKYLGGAIQCDTEDGWQIELLKKSLSNLDLPTSISEIIFVNRRGQELRVTGKNDSWRLENGELVNLENIVRWFPTTD
jgi:hypothetical protein